MISCSAAINVGVLDVAGGKKARGRNHEYDADAFRPIHDEALSSMRGAMPNEAGMRRAGVQQERRGARQTPPCASRTRCNDTCGGDDRTVALVQGVTPAHLHLRLKIFFQYPGFVTHKNLAAVRAQWGP